MQGIFNLFGNCRHAARVGWWMIHVLWVSTREPCRGVKNARVWLIWWRGKRRHRSRIIPHDRFAWSAYYWIWWRWSCMVVIHSVGHRVWQLKDCWRGRGGSGGCLKSDIYWSICIEFLSKNRRLTQITRVPPGVDQVCCIAILACKTRGSFLFDILSDYGSDPLPWPVNLVPSSLIMGLRFLRLPHSMLTLFQLSFEIATIASKYPVEAQPHYNCH